MRPETIVWRKVGFRPSLYHVDNGHDRSVCSTGLTLTGPVAPDDFKHHGPALVNVHGVIRYPATASVCMRCRAWLEKRGRWPDDGGL